MPFFVIATLGSGKKEVRRNEHGQLALEERVAGFVAQRIGRYISKERKPRLDRKNVIAVQVMEFSGRAECESYLADINKGESA